ncbi:NAD(P)/FAD-dependent oxidoreductase [Aurantibacillus circumpalustris]|uniref:NAD(P)/FAD-dependent oxidoreductase n=1 Tax=Aurantibacillus circumpalustris TaxID=3036359 RepID=UPI00295AD2D8|nr:FAD-dependent oxidoreductase [Aurantibacillus circumpalustris]
MYSFTDFNYSYWETKQYFQTFDLIVVGSGIVGLSTAISFKELNPKAKILVLEKGLLPNGASTKNAGFACFGSVGELLDDLNSTTNEVVWDTVLMRWKGLNLLRNRLKDKNINYQALGGFELFHSSKEFNYCKENIQLLNNQIKNNLGLKNCYKDISSENPYFKSTKGIILNSHEGQLDTMLMMKNLLLLAAKRGIEILNNIEILEIIEANNKVELKSELGVFKAFKVVVATNGFAKYLLKIKDVKPARAQVLVTKPINNLKIKGAFHFLKGYYYFRNIDNRILFGGGRNLDFKLETTAEQGLNHKIHKKLDEFLQELILPGVPFEIEQRWSGIMGVGKEKLPIIKNVGKNVLAAVRMGGMGIAIGSAVGEKSAKIIS